MSEPQDWIGYLQLHPPMQLSCEQYLLKQMQTAQVDMDKYIDAGDLGRAQQFKGKRDAFATMLHHVRSQAEGG